MSIKDIKMQSLSHYNHFLHVNDEADVLFKKVECLQEQNQRLVEALELVKSKVYESGDIATTIIIRNDLWEPIRDMDDLQAYKLLEKKD
jgi:hypothetical protein